MSEHTPGPWEWKWGEACKNVLYAHRGAETRVVLELKDGAYTAPLPGDRPLIEAAPELLAACEAQSQADELLWRHIEPHAPSEEYIKWRQAQGKAEALRQAAIAKAGGNP